MRDQRDPQTLGIEIYCYVATHGVSVLTAADAVLRGNPIKSLTTNGSEPTAESPSDRHPENGSEGRNDALR